MTWWKWCLNPLRKHPRPCHRPCHFNMQMLWGNTRNSTGSSIVIVYCSLSFWVLNQEVITAPKTGNFSTIRSSNSLQIHSNSSSFHTSKSWRIFELATSLLATFSLRRLFLDPLDQQGKIWKNRTSHLSQNEVR